MQKIFDTDDPPLSQEEMEAVLQNARDRLALWRKRGFYSTAAFLLNCLFVYFFLEGSPLHAYWESFGKYLLLLAMRLVVVSTYCVGLWWAAWRVLHGVEKGQI